VPRRRNRWARTDHEGRHPVGMDTQDNVLIQMLYRLQRKRAIMMLSHSSSSAVVEWWRPRSFSFQFLFFAFDPICRSFYKRLSYDGTDWMSSNARTIKWTLCRYESTHSFLFQHDSNSIPWTIQILSNLFKAHPPITHQTYLVTTDSISSIFAMHEADREENEKNWSNDFHGGCLLSLT
jgi:hypothetical protein